MGEDSYGWVRKAERFFEFNPVDECNKVNFASIHFEGQAEYWFGAYIKTKERVLWPEFVKDVHSRFAKLFKESVVGEFRKLRQQSSVEAYYNDFETIRSMMVSEGCKLEEEYFTQSFISGLKEEIRLEVEKFETSDLSRAIFLARKDEASIQLSMLVVDEEGRACATGVMRPSLLRTTSEENQGEGNPVFKSQARESYTPAGNNNLSA
ncbi:hypothetical protein RJ640_000029 [Escallonia rubra]|uniref:Ty3 transposon capsid-like protein domain-containing protein n=1 Tax=Escallonia rubra TaxID=112253 RepID=A0AA88UL79_9ASTE|nr:hypothetical protein RJ640_000029 [Escallonia rubra]